MNLLSMIIGWFWLPKLDLTSLKHEVIVCYDWKNKVENGDVDHNFYDYFLLYKDRADLLYKGG